MLQRGMNGSRAALGVLPDAGRSRMHRLIHNVFPRPSERVFRS